MGTGAGRGAFDCIVVGGGSAGSVLATRLVEQGAWVALFEAGRDFGPRESWPALLNDPGSPLIETEYNWIYPTDRGGRTYTGKVLGGGSSVNGALFVRPLTEDFESWGANWKFEHLLPSFVKMEADQDFQAAWHGTDGPIPVSREQRDRWLPFQAAFVGEVLGAGFPYVADLNAPGRIGVGPFPKNVAGGSRVNMAAAYIDRVRGRPNLHLAASTRVTRVLFHGNRAVGVEYLDSGRALTAHAGQVILSAGAFETPHLLTLSGVGPEVDLRRNGIQPVEVRAGVGANLQEHAAVPIAWRPRPGVIPALGESRRYQTSLFYSTDGSPSPVNMQIVPGYSRADEALGDYMRSADALRFSCILNAPESRGRLSLVSPDPRVPMQIQFDLMSAAVDREAMAGAIELCVNLAQEPLMRELIEVQLAPAPGALSSLEDIKRWVVDEARPAFHASSTCRLGVADDPAAVVDDQLRVLGLEGLWVVDLSVIPRALRANPNATAVMLGERAATLITSAAGSPAGGGRKATNAG